MTQLHELLAVEPDRKNTAKKVRDEGMSTLTRKEKPFDRVEVTFEPDKELTEGEQAKINRDEPPEIKTMTTTVNRKLAYIEAAQSKHFDVLFQKEEANSRAKGDIILDDGTKIAENVPTLVLLALERELTALREVYNLIPTLDTRVDWSLDTNTNFHKNTKEKIRTEKTPFFNVVVKASDKHPAQTNKEYKDVRVGVVKTFTETSRYTAAEKSDLLARTDRMIRAIKKARMRANREEVKDLHIGVDIFKYLHG